jgi:hypothetical protein
LEGLCKCESGRLYLIVVPIMLEGFGQICLASFVNAVVFYFE